MPSTQLGLDPFGTTPAQVAFAGDWEAEISWADISVERAAEVGADVIVQLGDFGHRFTRRYLEVVDDACRRTGVPVLFVDGNHEDHQWLARQPLVASGARQIASMVYHLPRGFRWSWYGIRFLALGGAHSVDRPTRLRSGQLWQPEERITVTDAALAVRGGAVDVLVSHDCPSGVDIPGLGTGRPMFHPDEIAQSNLNRRLLATIVEEVRPAAVWHGHYHRRYRTTADFGYGPVTVNGLGLPGDGGPEVSLHILPIEEIAAMVEELGSASGLHR